MRLSEFRPPPPPEKGQSWQGRSAMAVLDVVEQEIRRTSKSPTRMEVASALGLSAKSAVQKHLINLVRGGFITMGHRGAVTITPYGHVSLGVFRAGKK